ncbi:MAG: tRNA glutamyl-Q(34) synthetase GluQRS [Clostridia bacterium]|nr:tRNA glutamyl-Q(34) synthetase GluQRS [Clostridia bacterium]MBR1684516.1 tRNA glutamyl-Q(34) synthetase GluQRS [Clostridia bacterium]
MEARVTGRFAPSPSGPMHLGNLACCLLAYLSARKQGGRFLVRIEDLDTQRCKRESGEDALRVLERFGFNWDETPLWQSERDAAYLAALTRLSSQNLLYPCFCTRAELMVSSAPNLGDTKTVYAGTCRSLSEAQIREKRLTRTPALRLRVPAEEIAFTDTLQGPVLERLDRDCGDFIVRRSDGLWSYQLAVVVDDGASSVTEVIRGRDILSVTPRQIYLQRLLDIPTPAYTHIPLLLDPCGKRLAKRDHALGLDALLASHSPQAILGMLACAYGLLPRPVPITPDDLIASFSWDRVPRTDVRIPEGWI